MNGSRKLLKSKKICSQMKRRKKLNKIAILHMCLAPFYLALEKRVKSQPVKNSISTFLSTSCVKHLQHSDPITLSGV